MAHITPDPALVADLCDRYAIQIGLFDLIQIKDELCASIGREVDLVTKGMLSPCFRDDVLAQREVICVSPK